MLKKALAILFIWFNLINHALSQNNLSYTPIPASPSPNAQSLGLFGEVPVSLFSGLPQISVPVYELSVKGITLPIVASYHASGTRIDQHPSWIGMGWSLNAGGAIDRVQRGIPDEKNYFASSTTGGILRGFYKTGSLIAGTNWAGSFLTTDIQIDGTDQLRNDLEPDEFKFSYPGNSGSFFLNEEGKWCVQSEKPVKVLFDNVDIDYPFPERIHSFSSERVFKKFTLVDGFGYKYVFGGVDEAIEYSDTYYAEGKTPDYFSATSWKLTKILAPTKEEIFELGYERGPTIAQLYTAAYQKTYSARSGSWGCGNTISSWYTSTGYPERGNFISPVYLKSIKCVKKDLKLSFLTSASKEMDYLSRNGENLNFTQNNPYISAFVGIYKDENPTNTTDPTSYGITPNHFLLPTFLNSKVPYFQSHTADQVYWKNILWLKLDAIEITNANGDAVKRKVKFIYDNREDERLRLANIEFLSSSSSSINNYKFEYDTQPVARYLKAGGDFWGFYNNSPSLPDIYMAGNLPNIANYKWPSLQHTKAGVLTKIVYPTGGSTTFEYELNTCSKVQEISLTNPASIVLQDYVKTIGGLRVRKVITNEANSGMNTKEYFYVKGYTAGVDPNTLVSSGVLQAKPKYSTYVNSSSFIYQSYYSNPAIPLTDLSSGAFIGYSEVVEKLSDGSYAINKYTNHDNGHGDEIFISSVGGNFNYQLPVSSRSHERGKLVEQTMYTNTNIPVSRVTNTYTRSSLNFARAVRNGKEAFCSVSSPTHSYTLSFNHWHKSAYKVFYNSLNRVSSLSRTYAQNNTSSYVDVFAEYKYNGNGDITEEKLTGSKGELIKKNYLYPVDFSGFEPYATMNQRSIVSPVVEEFLYKDNKFIQSNKTNYDFWDGNNWILNDTAIVVPRRVETKAHNHPNYEPRLQYLSYDDKGNVTSVSKEGAVPTSYIWGYNKAFPIAKVDNCKTVNSAGEQWYQTFWMVDHMNSGQMYTFSGSCTFPKAVSATITREYLKGTDHSASFYVYIYDSNNTLVKTFYDSMNQEQGSLTLTSKFNMAPGTYSVKVNSSNPYGRTYTQEVGITMEGFAKKPASLPYYTSFEEDQTAIDGTYKTGKKSHVGTYTIVLPPCPPDNNKYIMSYWLKQSATSPWELVKQNITTTYEYSTVTIGGANKYIDEVRIYPENGLMTTYTYDPSTGMTSETNPRDQTSYYQYDNFQRLQHLKDQDGNIVKSLDYHYKLP